MKLLTPEDAARHVGVSKSLIYTWCKGRLLPHYRFGIGGRGGKIMIAIEELEKFIAACRIEEGDATDEDNYPLRHIR